MLFRSRQDKVHDLRRIAEANLAKVHLEAKVAWDNGATEQEMKPVLTLIRHAQWRWDWVAAANGHGIHSTAECLRVLGTSIQKSNEARILLTEIFMRHGVEVPVKLPDISTKEKAQQVIGLPMDQIRANKKEFLKTTLPEWIKIAAEREEKMGTAL